MDIESALEKTQIGAAVGDGTNACVGRLRLAKGHRQAAIGAGVWDTHLRVNSTAALDARRNTQE